jgi:hypothetical protein
MVTFNFTSYKKTISILFMLAFLVGCNQQEFYEKEYLDGVGVEDDAIPNPGIEPPTTTPPVVEVPTHTVTQTETKTETNTQTETKTETNTQTETKTETNTQTETKTETNTQTETKTETNTQTETKTETNTQTETKTETNTQTETATETNTQTETATETNTQTETATETNTQTETQTNTETATETETETETEVSYLDVTDKFNQNFAEQQKLDILWVVDNSGSMRDEQNALAYNFNAFISAFLDKDVDFKMAVTTTDANSHYNGKVVGSLTELNSTSAKDDREQFLRDFSETIRVGTNGSPHERGLHTSQMFMHRYANKWLRDQAYLVIVYVSDEQDQSSKSVASYVDYFRKLKDNESKVKLFSIVKTSGRRNAGTRYMDASNKTGGLTSSITDDFHTTLQNMSQKIVNLLATFKLTQAPYNGNVSVSVNGNETNSGWNYDEKTQSVTFEKDDLPSEGSSIEVKYQVEKKD